MSEDSQNGDEEEIDEEEYESLDVGIPIPIPPRVVGMLHDVVEEEEDIQGTAIQLMQNAIHQAAMNMLEPEDVVRTPYKDLLLEIQSQEGRGGTTQVRRSFVRDVTNNYMNVVEDEEIEESMDEDEEDGEEDDEEEEDNDNGDEEEKEVNFSTEE